MRFNPFSPRGQTLMYNQEGGLGFNSLLLSNPGGEFRSPRFC